MADIYTTSHFRKAFKRLPKHIKEKAAIKEKFFKQDPFYSLLDTHPLYGKYKIFYSFSIDNSYRIIFQFLNAAKTKAVFIDVGKHDIYK